MMYRHLTYMLLVLLAFSCAKDEENPYDDIIYPTVNPTVEDIPQSNFAYLHQKIFRPTCANSGCHDGSFEPEFRTIGSAYNSLVLHPGISNDLNNTYEFRVLPGNADLSLLYARLTEFLPNSSGVMPLELDAGSDWLDNEDEYIQAVKDWIDNGAADMFGAQATAGDLRPQVNGFLAFPNNDTNTPFTRMEGVGVTPIEVPAEQIDLWFSVQDDNTSNQDLGYNKYKMTTNAFGFAMEPEQDLALGSSISGPGFDNATVSFDRKADVDLSAYTPGTYLFVRIYLDDGVQADITEVPNDGTGSPMKDYFTLIVVP